MRSANVGHPIAPSFIDGVFQGARARLDTAYFSPEQPHAKNVQFLTPHVLGAHVNDTFETEERANSSSGDAVLSCTGFGDDAALAHAFGQQSLPETVVDFVCPGVKQIFALEVDLCAAKFLGESAREK